MSIFTFLIGWLFHEDFVKEHSELHCKQEEEMRLQQEELDTQNWSDMMQAWEDQDDDR
jgi:hypothetical protein